MFLQHRTSRDGGNVLHRLSVFPTCFDVYRSRTSKHLVIKINTHQPKNVIESVAQRVAGSADLTFINQPRLLLIKVVVNSYNGNDVLYDDRALCWNG